MVYFVVSIVFLKWYLTLLLLLSGEVVSNHDELMSNFFAQPDALAYGKVVFCFLRYQLFLFTVAADVFFP